MWTTCPDCEETSVPPFNDRPASVLNGTLLRPASRVAVCSACGSVISENL
jgi:ribosomal protein S27E